MTQDEIIKMAWDSGACTHRITTWGFSLENLERFAAAIAAKALAQRTWVGLTADEQSFVFDQVKQIVDSKPFWVRFADAIEAKIKEKNT